MQSSLFFCVTYFYYSRREVVSTTGACRVKVTQSSGIAMSGVRHVNKIPTIRGTDILRDARLNKVKRLKVVENSQRYFFAHTTYQLTFIFHPALMSRIGRENENLPWSFHSF